VKYNLKMVNMAKYQNARLKSCKHIFLLISKKIRRSDCDQIKNYGDENGKFPVSNIDLKNPHKVLGNEKRAQTEDRHDLHSCGGILDGSVCLSSYNNSRTAKGIFRKSDIERF
jgi:argonaute-like protein implicated in RNA metabolism and viral defense